VVVVIGSTAWTRVVFVVTVCAQEQGRSEPPGPEVSPQTVLPGVDVGVGVSVGVGVRVGVGVSVAGGVLVGVGVGVIVGVGVSFFGVCVAFGVWVGLGVLDDRGPGGCAAEALETRVSSTAVTTTIDSAIEERIANRENE